MTADVAVIGAGFAGLSAAVRLATTGYRVLVVEEKPRLGGRATAFTDRETGERVDNGQHALFGCYRETFAFLEAIGTADLVQLQPRLSLLMASAGRAYRLACPPLPPPWHLLAGVLRWRALSGSDRWAVLRMRNVLRDARRHGAAAAAARVSPDLTVTAWLRQERQPPHLCRWLWEPLAIAALNQAPDEAAAQPFVRVLAELFGPRAADSTIGLPSVPLDELYAGPSQRRIEALGGRVVQRARARLRIGTDERLELSIDGEHQPVAAIISAVPWHDLARLWAADVPGTLHGLVERANAMVSCPIVTANLWFDAPITTSAFVGLVDGPMHWAFDKAVLYGRERPAHLAVVASGARELAALDNAEVARRAVGQLADALPNVRARRLVRSVVVREHRATFSVAPGAPRRPGTVTAVPGFFLAGDWIDTGLPGTIESAVISGHRAAAAAAAYLRERPTAPGA
ncbi:MAG: FAD-dependent oxidoreductase [Acidobacteria bacterium]|nr:FAD-dependent oxidoreductase [Acidobacteriota bacterium]